MNLKLKIAFIVASIIVIIPLSKVDAQTDDILRRLKAETIKSKVYLHVRNDQIYYMHDAVDNNRTSAGFLVPENEKLLWTSRSKKVMLSIGFYNPYQYSVKANSAISDDPISQTTDDFFSAITGMLNVVTTGTPIATSTSANNFTSFASPSSAIEINVDSLNALAPANRLFILNADDLQKIRTPSIIEWSLWIQTPTARTCNLDTVQIKSLFKSIANIETLLFQKFKIDNAELNFEGHIKRITYDLYSPENTTDLISALQSSRKILKDLKGAITNAKSNLGNIKSENRKFTISGAGFCSTFPLYHQMMFAQYGNEIEEKIKKLEKIISTMDGLIKIGDDFLEGNKVFLFNGNEKEIIYNKELTIEDDKLNSITMEVSHQMLNENDSTISPAKKEFKRSFEITKFRRAWPELSSGIFFSKIQYNTYSTGEAVTSSGSIVATSPVVQTSNNQRFLAALFYNMVFDAEIHPIYPFLQLGVGTGKEYPCLLTGGGFRIINKDSKRISISSGLVLPFTQELDKLEVEEQISGGQAQIDEDVKYHFAKHPGFYIGIAFKLN